MKVWIGCTSRHFLKDTVRSLEKLLLKINENMEIIDDKELCCGSVLFTTGQVDDAIENIKKVERVLNEKGVEELVSICPGCTRTFKEYYTPLDSNPLKSAKHISEILVENLDKLNLKNDTPCVATYHDPCHLGRHMGIMEGPRRLIQAVPDITLKEMKYTGENSFCCGSGGGVRAFNKELADDASALRVREAKSTGALFLITACPFCERSFRSAQENKKELDGIVVVNLVDFMAEFVE
jgi:heterodisulfide reductase subunit D